MTPVQANIELTNGADLALLRHSIIGEGEVKRTTIQVRVDTTNINLCINEAIQKQMQFPVVGKRKMINDDGVIVECDVVSCVNVRFQNRTTSGRAIVLPGASKALLGRIPLMDMDVVIDAERGVMTVNPAHPDMACLRL